MTTAPDHGALTNQALVDAGWVRRYLAAPDRAQEALDTYQAAGFEVRLERLTPRDFGSQCQGCAATICTTYVVVYTRKQAQGEP